MRSLLKIALGIAALVVAFGAGWLVAITGTGQAIPLESLSELERGFAERMQNVVLTGHYTLKGRERRDDNQQVTFLGQKRRINGISELPAFMQQRRSGH